MHKLNLETLTKERIENSVDPETFQLGVDLYQQQSAQIVDLTESQARCIVHDKRNFHVHLKVEKQHLFLKCSCSHASRGLICEHEVAAYLSLRDRLTESLPPSWSGKIETINNLLNDNPARVFSQPYYLFFSLQKDPAQNSLAWRIEAYTIFAVAISISNAGQESPNSFWDQILQSNPNLQTRMRPVSQPLDVSGCINGGSTAASLANLILRIKKSNPGNALFPIEFVLPLVRQSGAFLGRGDPSSPFQVPLTIIPEPADLNLNIDSSITGFTLEPLIIAGERVFSLEYEDIEYIHPTPLWILHDRKIIELQARISEEKLRTVINFKQISIPFAEESYFLEHFLLDLARTFEIRGTAVTWKEIQLDPIPRLYLNEKNGELLIQLRFAYQDIEVNFDPSLPEFSINQREQSWNLVKLHRQSLMEQGWRDLLISSSYGLKRAVFPLEGSHFQLRARTHPATFLLDSLPRLSKEGFEIFGEERLRTARVNRNTPTISFKISSGIDWFDLQALVNFGDLEVPLNEIRRVIRKQERFIKLADGSIGEIPAKWLEDYQHLFAVGNPHADSLRYSRHQISLLDQAVEAADRLEMDEEFTQRRMKLKVLMDGDFKGIETHMLPSGFLGELRPYQAAGFNWLHFLREFQLGGCLADDMGLGKTIQALALLLSVYQPSDGEIRPTSASLLVVPRSLLVNWQREAARFTPQLKLLEYFDADREKNLAAFDEQDVIITTYGILLRDIQFLNQYSFHYALLDESQTIKNPLSQTAHAAQLIRAENRLVLTGTPVENSTSELWSQFAFLNPGLLGNLKYFKNEFGVPIEKNKDAASAEKLRKIVYPLILRRTKDQVAPELPPRTERILYCDMETAQRRLYLRTRDSYRGMILDMVEKDELNGGQMRILEGLLRLRQIANHPALVDKKFHGSSGKFELLLGTIETLIREGHKTLIFSQFVSMLSLIRQDLDKRNIPYSYLDGQTNARQQQVDLFQGKPEIPLFLISLKAGGLGLNLTAADYVIHIDPWWNPAVEMQASDRSHRIGQDKPVFVYKLITRDSVEEKILQLQSVKKQLVDQLISNESSFLKEINIEDLKVLFS